MKSFQFGHRQTIWMLSKFRPEQNIFCHLTINVQYDSITFGSRSFIFWLIILRKSLKSIDPFVSASTSCMSIFNSSFFGSNPSALRATLKYKFYGAPKSLKLTFNSLMLMVPVPSVSNRSNASLISAFCSSVSSFFFWFFLFTAVLRYPDIIQQNGISENHKITFHEMSSVLYRVSTLVIAKGFYKNE